MAIEDSAVLAKLFGHLISADQVASFLYAFPELRQGRTKSTRVNEMANIYFMAMPDDSGAIQRDQHFKARRDKNLSPLEDESGDASGAWESIKETWCYDAEDEADDWWVGWGMLRLRSQKTELEFGMEVQVGILPYCSRDHPTDVFARTHRCPWKFPSNREFPSKRLYLLGGSTQALPCFLCRFALSAYTIPHCLSFSFGPETVRHIHLPCIRMYLRSPSRI